MTTGLWLTQIVPNTRDRAVLKDLRDATHLHRRIMTLFPDGLGDRARHQAAALFRLEEQPDGFSILVQSSIKPTLDNLAADYGAARTTSLTPLLKGLTDGANVHYRIIANATSKLGNNTTAGRPKQVVPLHGADADQWWQRQADSAGLILRSLHSSQLPGATGRRGNARMTHARTRFDGTATVTDSATLIEKIRAGIGRGKPYGCGLLTIAPA
ncbi:type I-E CRISPR-associated protein Cas6/Cse3/CasE [Actinomadura graeca]|uniref:Type I-E CRISPR-associated protein Cas6/Cse3/CasE n=1 Tax=Actinomadura graeca TaxID=2750812 RepID=A0ABX8R9U1_9ACTN|nr:type I-E CRISPR-associated protein Cas6/Cse3/CasE [Actinomadura graeca]QXJ25748.1 type I-E CRISPR-associated protein Cas6/Cse3/CasE [Actinomadura graeca]